MYQLMISLDKKMLEEKSAVARRMVEYGKNDELFVVIPCKEKKSFDLSPTVYVQSTGGTNKIMQFLNLYLLGGAIIKKQFNNSTIQQFISTQDPFFTGLVGFLLKKRFGIKLEVQMHGDFFGDYYRKQWLRLCLAKFVIKRADTIRVVGERIRISLIKFGIAENKIIIRPIVIGAEKIKNYQPKINLCQKYPDYEKIFLVLGRLDPVKNIVWLLDVFKEIIKQKNYLLLIVGSGDAEQDISSKIINNRLEKNVKLENWADDPISYIKTTDCVLFPSLSEGYGLVPMEAEAAGTPIIMSDVGVANYELKPGGKNTIIPIADKLEWIRAILNV